MSENPYADNKLSWERQQATEKAKAKPTEAPKPIAVDYVPIPDVGTHYRLFKDGRLASLMFLKTHINKKGFKAINIRDSEGKQHTYLLHMLIARIFIDNPLGRTHVRFKDGNKLNCAVENLDWV